MANILITGALIISGESPGRIDVHQADVWVQGNRIARVGDRGRLSPDWAAAETIDGSGCALIPGMVNCHTHAAMSLLRGYADDIPLDTWLRDHIWPVEERLEPGDVYAGTVLAAAEMIRAGITAFADMYFFMDEVARAVTAAGMRARLSRGLIGAAPDAGERLEEAVEWAQRWQGCADGRIRTELGPHAIYTCPPDYLKRVLDAASRHGLSLHIHLSETAGEVSACIEEHGVSPVRLVHNLGLFEVPVLAAHCVHMKEGDVELLVDGGVAIAHSPISNMKLASGFAPLPDMLAAGATIGLGSDGAASTSQINLFSEMKACSLPQKALSGDAATVDAASAFYMATRGGALALGLDSCGLIEPGFLADLCLVDLDLPHLVPIHDPLSALVYSAQGSEVRTVVCDGRVLMRDRQLTTLDLEQVMALSRAAASRLTSR